MSILKNVKVLDLGDFISAPFCARLLADLGAEVIKIEFPDRGDSSRYHGPFENNLVDNEKSGFFIFLNYNKQSIKLDVATPEGYKILLELIRKCDVVVENFHPRHLSEIGLDYKRTSEVNSSLIHCSLTSFGHQGPYRDYLGSNLHTCAVSGVTWAIGSPDREPLGLPLNQSDFQLGINGAAAILLALRHRRKKGGGQHIDISAADVMASYAGVNSVLYLLYDLKWHRAGRRAYSAGGLYPYGIFPCKDGYVCIIARTKEDWDRLLDALGNPEWSKNPRYADQRKIGRDYADEADQYLISELRKYTQSELFKMAQDWDFPLGPVRNIQQTMEEPHFQSRKVFYDLPGFLEKQVKIPRSAYRFSNEQPQNLKPAPRLGEHSELVLSGLLGMSEEKLSELKERRII